MRKGRNGAGTRQGRQGRGLRKSRNGAGKDAVVAAMQSELALLRDENAQLRLERQQNVTPASARPARDLRRRISRGAEPGEIEWATLSEALMLARVPRERLRRARAHGRRGAPPDARPPHRRPSSTAARPTGGAWPASRPPSSIS